MLFIHPMWDSECERIGKQRCTPTGYALHVFADLLGFIGLLVLLPAPFFIAWRWLGGTFRTYHLWLLAVPIAIGLASEAIYRYSWRLALSRGFSYNPERREASWLEAGERRTYRFADDTGTDDAM
jgi:hypothetical protein